MANRQLVAGRYIVTRAKMKARRPGLMALITKIGDNGAKVIRTFTTRQTARI